MLYIHTHTHTSLKFIAFSFCSAALTGRDPPSLSPSLLTLLPPLFSSPLVHPHKSLMMCRLHRAGLSSNTITISKNLLLPYGPTNCGMLYTAGCLIITLHLFVLVKMTTNDSVCYTFLSLLGVCCFN